MWKFILLLIIFAGSIIGIWQAIEWDNRIKPDPTIAMPSGEVGLYTPGLHELMKVSRKYDKYVAPNHIVRINSTNTERLKEQIKYLAPKIGWYVIQGRKNSNYFRVTLPEEDLKSIQQLKDDPEKWVVDNTNADRKLTVAEDAINIDLTVVSYHDRTIWPIVVNVIFIILAIITAVSIIIFVIFKS